jgi:hypothetical protein
MPRTWTELMSSECLSAANRGFSGVDGYLLKDRVSDIAVLADATRRIERAECMVTRRSSPPNADGSRVAPIYSPVRKDEPRPRGNGGRP